MFNAKPRRLRLNHRRVLVNLVTGNAIAGVVTEETSEILVLRAATVHTPDAEPVKADGEVHIDRINVDFIQML